MKATDALVAARQFMLDRELRQNIIVASEIFICIAYLGTISVTAFL